MLKSAIVLLEVRVGSIARMSSVYSTKAWGETNQPDFLNQVVVIPYTGTAKQALEIVLSIEREMGRVRSKKWGARSIDIDLLYFGDQVYRTEILTVPHAALHLRRFTLVPLVEILPEFVHPIFNKTQKQLLDECIDELEVLKLE